MFSAEEIVEASEEVASTELSYFSFAAPPKSCQQKLSSCPESECHLSHFFPFYLNQLEQELIGTSPKDAMNLSESFPNPQSEKIAPTILMKFTF